MAKAKSRTYGGRGVAARGFKRVNGMAASSEVMGIG
jgi:hypothetical protein